jgi:subtilisin family serine protease
MRVCCIIPLGILSLADGGGGTGTTRMYGTSMATPHVTGVVARMIQNNVAHGGSAPANGDAVETLRQDLRNNASQKTIAPLKSPSGAYTDDGEQEGIAEGRAASISAPRTVRRRESARRGLRA